MCLKMSRFQDVPSTFWRLEPLEPTWFGFWLFNISSSFLNVHPRDAARDLVCSILRSYIGSMFNPKPRIWFLIWVHIHFCSFQVFPKDIRFVQPWIWHSLLTWILLGLHIWPICLYTSIVTSPTVPVAAPANMLIRYVIVIVKICQNRLPRLPHPKKMLKRRSCSCHKLTQFHPYR